MSELTLNMPSLCDCVVSHLKFVPISTVYIEKSCTSEPTHPPQEGSGAGGGYLLCSSWKLSRNQLGSNKDVILQRPTTYVPQKDRDLFTQLISTVSVSVAPAFRNTKANCSKRDFAKSMFLACILLLRVLCICVNIDCRFLLEIQAPF